MTLFTSSEEINGFTEGSTLALVYFSADDCSLCRALKPRIEEMAKEFPGLEACEINLSTAIEASAVYNVFVVPAVLVFTEGKESRRFARNFSIGELRDTIQRYSELLI